MKKLALILAAAGATLASHAASVTWTSNTGSAKTFLVDGDGNQIGKDAYPGLGVNLILVALSGDDLTAYKNGTYAKAYNADSVLSTGAITESTKSQVKGSFSNDFKFTYNETDTSANPIKDGDVLAVLITDGKTMSNISYYDTTLGKVTDTREITGLAKDQDLWTDTFNFATKGNFTAGTANVPEPTSGLLVLVGLAGLALKRKRA